MQIQGSSQDMWLQQMQQRLQQAATTASALQDVPSQGQDLPGTASSGSPSGGSQTAGAIVSPMSLSSDQFAPQMMSSLLAAQAQPSASDLASRLMSALDTNGNGSLSLDEMSKAVGSSGSDSTSQAAAFKKLDTNGDGTLSATELTTAIQTLETGIQQNSGPQQTGGAHHHHHHHRGAEATASTGAAAPGPAAAAVSDTGTTAAVASA